MFFYNILFFIIVSVEYLTCTIFIHCPPLDDFYHKPLMSSLWSLAVSGSPLPTVSWLKDGLPVRSRIGLSLQQEADQHLLCVDRVQRSDAGQYGCTATNSRGNVSATWTLHVKSKSLFR